jgi:MurNAc alpha-1-phosphate uridylyltransferase
MPPLMLFAAGFGTRMGALTANHPKPLIPVAGKALIDHALALADGAGVKRTVVNLHYRGDQIRQHLAGRDVLFSDETAQILETGGGLRAALPLLAGDPVLVLNSDAVWTGENPLIGLQDDWRDGMGALLTLLPTDMATGHTGHGDFVMDSAGRLQRGKGPESYVYLGAHMTRTDGLAGFAEESFGLMRLWEQMMQRGELYGRVHRGGWCDVGRPEGIAIAETLLQGLSA